MTATDTPGMGDNNPPRDSILEAQRAFKGLSDYLKEHPVVESQDDAKEAAAYVNGAKDVLKILEEDRDGLVRPLNEQVRKTNDEFKSVREPLDKLIKELLARIEHWRAAEEEKRRVEAERLAKEAAEKERLAREAEAKEREAIENAAEGEFTDVGAATEQADAAFDDFRRTNRAAARAERNTTVRISDGLGIGRALSARTTETLEVTDALAAVKTILEARNGTIPEKLNDAILSAARDYRKMKDALPAGVVSRKSRSL